MKKGFPFGAFSIFVMTKGPTSRIGDGGSQQRG